MSWNVNLNDVEPLVHEIEPAATIAYRQFKAGYGDDAEVFAAMDEQFDAALLAMRCLLAGAVGAGNVNITLSGHANPGHQPRQGWANDYVSVHVSSVVRAEAPAS